MERKLKSMLSLCQKSGKLASGEDVCARALQVGKAYLVIVCNDASGNTKKKFSQKAFYYKVPYYSAFSKDELQSIIGRQNRATIAVMDKGFADKIAEMLELFLKQNPEVDLCPKQEYVNLHRN